MGLSNYLPNSRISQSGVCTSSTRPASPYEGQMIYETDTNRVLVWDNAAWVDPSTGQTQRSGLVQMVPGSVSSSGSIDSNGTVTFSGALSIEVRNVFTSSFDNYRVMISSFTSSGTTTRNVRLQLMSNTTAETNSEYNWGHFFGYSTATSGWSGGTNESSALLCASSNQAGATGNIIIDVCGPGFTVDTTINYTCNTYQASIPAQVYRNGYCLHYTNTAYNGFKINGTTDNIEGTIRVYGYNQ